MKTEKSGILLIIFTVAYLFFEITFNIGLVDFINSKNTEIGTFNKLETLGRLLSSVGLSLFILNVVKIKKNAVKAISFVALLFALYFTQNYVFNKIVDGLPDETKLSAYSFGVYRNVYLNNSDKSAGFKDIFSADAPHYNEVSNAMIGVLLYNKEKDEQVENYVKDFFKTSFSLNSDDLGNVYDKLSAVSDNGKVNNLWDRYYIESKKYNNYTGLFKSEYHKKFVEAIGIEPNLTKDQFVEALKQKDPNMQKINNVAIVPENKAIGMDPLYLKDIPQGLTKEQWVDYVKGYIKKALDKVAYEKQNVNNFPHAKSIISSVIIVPIAIILSFLSIILNIGVVISFVSKRFGFVWYLVVVLGFAVMSFMSNYYKLPKAVNGFMHMEDNYITLMKPYRAMIHHTFVNDKDPNKNDIIVISKPTVPDVKANYDEIEAKFSNLSKASSGFNVPVQDNSVKIDESKLKDRGYYGEVNKANPYTSQ